MLCALCRKYERQEISHIIPSFVYKKLRNISPSGRFRGTSNPNRRIQDGEKFPLLCPRCEDKFSEWERRFAETVFHPYYLSSKNTFSFSYDKWFLKFLVSISYRALVSKIEKKEFKNHSKECIRRMKEAKGIWKDFLLEKRDDVGLYKQHFFILPIEIKSDSYFLQENNGLFKFYLFSGTDSDTVCAKHDSEFYLIVKFGEFFIVSSIIDRHPSQWSGLTINFLQGEFKLGCVVYMPYLVTNFIESAIQKILLARENISPTQSEKIKLSVEEYLRKHNMEL